MKPAKIFHATMIGFLATCLAWAGDPWKEKTWTEWTQKDVEKILLNSPWAKNIYVNSRPFSGSGPMEKPINTAGLTKSQAENEAVLKEGQRPMNQSPVTEGRSEAPPPGSAARSGQGFGQRQKLTLRWFSSRTVRQGLIRNWQLQLNALPRNEEVQDFLQRQNPNVAQDPAALEQAKIRVEQRRAILRQNIAQMEARLGRPTEYFEVVVNPIFLSETSRENLSAVSYLQPKKSKEKIPPAIIESSGQSLIFYFPRQIEGRPVILPDEKKVRFRTKIGGREVKTDFDLRKMLRDGQLDL